MPEGVNPDEYYIIGKDVTRILHRRATNVLVEVVERPIMRLKAYKEQPSPRIEQVAAPEVVIGDRQAKMYAELGVKLPTSTINN